MSTSSPPASLIDTMRLGLIQNDINAKVAWKNASTGFFTMDVHEANRGWNQVKTELGQFKSAEILPDIILLPELGIPRDKVPSLVKYSQKEGVILIAGLDYKVDFSSKLVSNEAVVIIPSNLKGKRRVGGSITKTIGKIYPAPKERNIITKAGYGFSGDKSVWLFDSLRIGRFGIAICYDLMDLERALMYRTQIHHLFVLAYNQDIDTFYHTAEALCRTLYCNVVICNTGHHGGSLAIKPYQKPWNRVIYRHEGREMHTSQILELPVSAIDLAHQNIIGLGMKSLPPGFPFPAPKITSSTEKI